MASWFEELLERDFCDFVKVIRITTYFKELLEMLLEHIMCTTIATFAISQSSFAASA
jgi:hypothetical protein